MLDALLPIKSVVSRFPSQADTYTKCTPNARLEPLALAPAGRSLVLLSAFRALVLENWKAQG
jgi:hypothetical protein